MRQVFTNKQIFASLNNIQVTFAAFHFALTGTLLYVVSRPGVALFEQKWAKPQRLVPIAIALCLNVILPNASLAFSSVVFYQLVRILLTPLVAILNYFLYQKKLGTPAASSLAVVCLGVGTVCYYDSLPRSGIRGNHQMQTTSALGVFFSFAGILASSIYTLWIAKFHEALDMNSMQLLSNQTPVGVLLLLFAIPWVDDLPSADRLTLHTWLMILLVATTVPSPEQGS
jgi:solute carrier family 35, member E3